MTLVFTTDLFSQSKSGCEPGKFMVYEDSGFCFFIGPHSLCSFIPSCEETMERLITVSRQEKKVYFFNVYGDLLEEYFDSNEPLNDRQLHTSKVTYRNAGREIKNLQYRRVHIKLLVPVSIDKTPKKESFFKLSLGDKTIKVEDRLSRMTIYKCSEIRTIHPSD